MRRNIKSKKLNNKHLYGGSMNNSRYQDIMDILIKIEHNTRNIYKSYNSNVISDISMKDPFNSVSMPKRSLSSSNLHSKKSKTLSKLKRSLSNSSKGSLTNSLKNLSMSIPPYKPFHRRFNVSNIPHFRKKVANNRVRNLAAAEWDNEDDNEDEDAGLEVEPLIVDGTKYLYDEKTNDVYDPDTHEYVGKLVDGIIVKE